MSGDLSLPLFWRVCLINGAVFALATVVLALSPATVSARPLWSEVVVLAVGFIVICVLNGLLLRSVLRPLDRFTAVMSSIDMRHPGRRLDGAAGGPTAELVARFNEMLGGSRRSVPPARCGRCRPRRLSVNGSRGSSTTRSARA